MLESRKQFITDFLEFLNARHGTGTVARMMLADLSMNDVEEYNRAVVKAGYSENVVVRQLQVVKAIIDRAGRPEYGGQCLRGTGIHATCITALPPGNGYCPRPHT